MEKEVESSDLKLERSFATHDGGFHADDVTACALLLHFGLIDRGNIVRSRDLELLDRYEYVCDVGGIYNPAQKRFDHHQSSYEGNLSSAGMVLAYLKDEGELDEREYMFLRDNLIDGVDAVDIGAYQPPLGQCTYSQVIAGFMPPCYEAPECEIMKGFETALDFARGHLKRILARFAELCECEHHVCDSMKSRSNYLEFTHAMPWLDIFFKNGGEDHPAQFVLMPSRGKWKVRGIPPTLEERMQVRKPLPEAWAGLLNDDLKKASGIEGAIFCHKGRFISIWETRADAEKALEIALAQ